MSYLLKDTQNGTISTHETLEAAKKQLKKLLCTLPGEGCSHDWGICTNPESITLYIIPNANYFALFPKEYIMYIDELTKIDL